MIRRLKTKTKTVSLKLCQTSFCVIFISSIIKEIKDEASNKRIKDEFETLQSQIKNLEKNNLQQLQKHELLDNSFQEQQKKMKELSKSLQHQIEDNELSLKRLTKEKEQTKIFAIQNFAKDMLDVCDNLERALETSKELEGKENTLYEGVKLTKNILDQIFKRNKINKLSPLDEKFDPNLHDAIFQYQDPSKESGIVGNVIYPGYTINERVIRPAKVGVVKNEK